MMEQGSPEWQQARCGLITASALSNVMMTKATAGYQNYAAQLVLERLTGRPTETFTSQAMQHGTDTEPQARAVYELETGREVQEVGFVPHPAFAMSGASPDGLVGDDGLVEIKCPQPAQHIRNLMSASVAKAYTLQMQWQMACTERQWTDFVSFNPDFPDGLQMHLRRYARDDKLIDEIGFAVGAFNVEVEAKEATLRQMMRHA